MSEGMMLIKVNDVWWKFPIPQILWFLAWDARLKVPRLNCQDGTGVYGERMKQVAYT